MTCVCPLTFHFHAINCPTNPNQPMPRLPRHTIHAPGCPYLTGKRCSCGQGSDE